MAASYLASKARSDRPGWSVTFRHPLRRDIRGKFGLKVRRGLNTTIEQRADELVRQLNELLQDETWWNIELRSAAESKGYDPIVVSAFFDGIEVGRPDSDRLRNAHIPLPQPDEGYCRALLVGTTGAGKTTLLRHLIGSRHGRDRFPSTSTTRTTIADTEIVVSLGSFRAAVTFISEAEARAHIDECIEAACVAAVEKQPEEKIANALLSHREQRFRLSYILGEWPGDTKDDEDFEFGASSTPALEPEDINEDEVVSEKERAIYVAHLRDYVRRIEMITSDVSSSVAQKSGSFDAKQAPEERADWLEKFSDALSEEEAFGQLGIDIKEDVESRFDILNEGGHVERSPAGWPSLWTYKTDNRDEFIGKVRWFSSNHFKQFGKLLTPLVDGIRVSGPFFPVLNEMRIVDKLVLIDGQGLGHTSETVASISTKVTKRFKDVDQIILVDSAQQSMQAAPVALLRAAATAGYSDKLLIAFTHFDQVKGDNLQTLAQKKAHVLASVTNALNGLRQVIGSGHALAIEKQIDTRTFLFGALDREITEIPKGVIAEIKRLLFALKKAVEPVKATDVGPIYNLAGLEIALRDAMESFRHPWDARLGLSPGDGIAPEHWTRVKALTKRFALGWSDEYDSLRPASDLISRLQEEISRWLEVPIRWKREPRDADERTAAINPIRSVVFSALHDLVTKRMAEEQREEWRKAYLEAGPGSALRRADEVHRIYLKAAPPISTTTKSLVGELITEVIQIIETAVVKAGGTFHSYKS